MMRMSRRSGIVSAVMLSLSVTMTGCLSPNTSVPNGPPQGMRTAAYPNQTGQPPMGAFGPNMMMPGGIKQAVHTQPQAGFGHAQPGAPGEEIIDGQLGMPQVMAHGPHGPMPPPVPRELAQTTLPPHRVAPPDVLLIEALRLIPKGPYRLEPLEVIQIDVPDALPKQEIKGLFMILPDGKVNLGHSYGSVVIGNLTVDQAQAAIRSHLSPIIKNASVSISIVQMRTMQKISGEHLVRPDGTVHLGIYGSVYVAGMSLGQVKNAIENYLAAYLVNPQVSVDVKAYNSRKVYIIADTFVNFRQQVIVLPVTGNEHVLDAISKVQGLNFTASMNRIWIARPSPAGHPCSQILPVDWKAITQAGRTETNYQLLPGDRIYIDSDPFWRAYFQIDKVLAPFERVLDFTFRAATTVQSIRNPGSTGVIVAP